MSDALTTQRDTAPVFSPEQEKMIRDSFLNGATPQEAAVLMELARLRRLNPITRQIHFVKRWDGEKNKEVWSAQVGIDGFRAIAERTGLYEGQDETEFEYEKDGKTLKLARTRVYRKGWTRPAVGVAHFSEYAQYKRDGSLTRMWATKPHVMLAKCSEALAFRKAFSEDTGGLYTAEEMGAENERDVTPAAAPQQPPAVTKAEVVDAELVRPSPPKATPAALVDAAVILSGISTAQHKEHLEKWIEPSRALKEPVKSEVRKAYVAKEKELQQAKAKPVAEAVPA